MEMMPPVMSRNRDAIPRRGAGPPLRLPRPGRAVKRKASSPLQPRPHPRRPSTGTPAPVEHIRSEMQTESGTDSVTGSSSGTVNTAPASSVRPARQQSTSEAVATTPTAANHYLHHHHHPQHQQQRDVDNGRRSCDVLSPCTVQLRVQQQQQQQQQDVAQDSSLLNLPLDLLLSICSKLEVEDWLRLMKTCTRFAEIGRFPELWRHCCKRDFGLVTRGKCKSYAELYRYFYKVHQLVLTDLPGDHLHKETDMLWFMAKCTVVCPVERWKTVPASKTRQFGLSRETMGKHCSGKMVATGQIGQGGRMVHHYTWENIVKTLLAVFSDVVGVQGYLIRRCLDHRITSSVDSRFEHLQMEQRQMNLQNRLTKRPDSLHVLLAGMYHGGLVHTATEPHLREQIIFLLHPLLRMYRNGQIRDGLMAVRQYISLCSYLQAGIQSSIRGPNRLCRRDGMEVYDYSACLCYVQEQLHSRLGKESVSFEDMVRVADEFFQRVRSVWQWQTSRGLVYMWRHRHSCIITGHAACRDFLVTGSRESFTKLCKYFEAREVLCERLDRMVVLMDGCIPRAEIETLYLAMGIMPPLHQPCCVPCHGRAPDMLSASGIPLRPVCADVPRVPDQPTATNVVEFLQWIPCIPRRYPPWADPWQDFPGSVPPVLPDVILHHAFKSADCWSLRSLHAQDQVMFRRTAIGWAYQEQLRTWLRSPLVMHKPVFHVAYDLVAAYLDSGRQDDAKKVLKLVIDRYHHHSSVINHRQTSIREMLCKVAEEPGVAPPASAPPARNHEHSAPQSAAPAPASRQQDPAMEPAAPAAPQFDSFLASGTLFPSSASLCDSTPTGGALSTASARDAGTQVNLSATTAAQVEPATAVTSDSPPGAPPALDNQHGKPALLKALAQPSVNRGLVTNNMIVTGYLHIDRDIHQYFCLYKEI